MAKSMGFGSQETYHATPRRISILAKHLTDFTKASQAKCSAKGQSFHINEQLFTKALESFVHPSNYGKSE